MTSPIHPRRMPALVTSAAVAMLASSAAVAQTIDPEALYGKWGVGAPGACLEGQVLVLGASGGLAGIIEGPESSLDAIGTWELNEGELTMRASQLDNLAAAEERALSLGDVTADTMTLTDHTQTGASITLHRCQG